MQNLGGANRVYYGQLENREWFRIVLEKRELTLTDEPCERKEDGKPCETSVAIILFEITFRQTSLSF